jgi:hypothetical protein
VPLWRVEHQTLLRRLAQDRARLRRRGGQAAMMLGALM